MKQLMQYVDEIIMNKNLFQLKEAVTDKIVIYALEGELKREREKIEILEQGLKKREVE